jgi:hypothetical protein
MFTASTTGTVRSLLIGSADTINRNVEMPRRATTGS